MAGKLALWITGQRDVEPADLGGRESFSRQQVVAGSLHFGQQSSGMWNRAAWRKTGIGLCALDAGRYVRAVTFECDLQGRARVPAGIGKSRRRLDDNFWSLLKRSLRGTYVAVEPFNLDAYVAEQVFRFNNRATNDNPLTDADRFTLAVSQISGKRLTYAELTGKVGERVRNLLVGRFG